MCVFFVLLCSFWSSRERAYCRFKHTPSLIIWTGMYFWSSVAAEHKHRSSFTMYFWSIVAAEHGAPWCTFVRTPPLARSQPVNQSTATASFGACMCGMLQGSYCTGQCWVFSLSPGSALDMDAASQSTSLMPPPPPPHPSLATFKLR